MKFNGFKFYPHTSVPFMTYNSPSQTPVFKNVTFVGDVTYPDGMHPTLWCEGGQCAVGVEGACAISKK